MNYLIDGVKPTLSAEEMANEVRAKIQEPRCLMRGSPGWQGRVLRFPFASINGAVEISGGQRNTLYHQRVEALARLMAGGAFLPSHAGIDGSMDRTIDAPIQILNSETEPRFPYRVQHRDHWFYVGVLPETILRATKDTAS